MNSKSYFRSSGYTTDSIIKTDQGEQIDLRTLPPFLRTLMVMDGTVTKSLSAWFWEGVNIEALQNQKEAVTSSIDGLDDLDCGDIILRREVSLRGENSNTLFACARSIVSLKHLPVEIINALERGKIGIGELLRENGIETYRDIFKINYYSSVPENDSLLSHLSREVISRTYRIRVNGVPAIIVTEFFPIGLFESKNVKN